MLVIGVELAVVEAHSQRCLDGRPDDEVEIALFICPGRHPRESLGEAASLCTDASGFRS